MMSNKAVIVAGSITMVQAVLQGIVSIIFLAQYHCIIDFLRGYPLLVYVRLLYFHSPEICNPRVNIGNIVDELPNQAFVLLGERPFTVTRTLIFSYLSFVFSVLWLMSSMFILATATKLHPIRWPWLISTLAICTLDMVATVAFANDSFHTRTLNDIVDYIGGTLSGAGNVVLNTRWASWSMVLLYSRFVIFFFFNLLFISLVLIRSNAYLTMMSTHGISERPTQTDIAELESIKEENGSNVDSDKSKIPRAGLNKNFHRMKNQLFSKKAPTTEQPSARSLTVGTTLRAPSPPRTECDKKRTVNFPENLLSLPQRLENLIAEQQKRLDEAVIDTAGRQSVTRMSQSLPHLSTTKQELNQTGDELNNRRGRRRSTVAELQGQLPWAYIQASANPMRDQLPPDEDLPPVPLPDYAAYSNFRKASVHRAASSLSSLTQKREEMKKCPHHKWSSGSTEE